MYGVCQRDLSWGITRWSWVSPPGAVEGGRGCIFPWMPTYLPTMRCARLCACALCVCVCVRVCVCLCGTAVLSIMEEAGGAGWLVLCFDLSLLAGDVSPSLGFLSPPALHDRCAGRDRTAPSRAALVMSARPTGCPSHPLCGVACAPPRRPVGRTKASISWAAVVWRLRRAVLPPAHLSWRRSINSIRISGILLVLWWTGPRRWRMTGRENH